MSLFAINVNKNQKPQKHIYVGLLLNVTFVIIASVVVDDR